ncbi:hypothetical protein OZ411_02970 [Bradyrhizobium sp. Arg237L]|uniref:hypothetical protein n=1 Tax=Bradyrhizobium sp. Arg237L TaxID=3003352 RepID=UPI00249E9464|nr:hypothetical protein [Bradyrhizobium sp. Arg237L]MDI4231771.1 hypothetical protein [Bradyrhizobium sp. Arg237L]
MTFQKFGRVFETLRGGLVEQLEALQRNLAQYPPIDHPMDVSEYETLSPFGPPQNGQLRGRPRDDELGRQIAHSVLLDRLLASDRL